MRKDFNYLCSAKSYRAGTALVFIFNYQDMHRKSIQILVIATVLLGGAALHAVMAIYSRPLSFEGEKMVYIDNDDNRDSIYNKVEMYDTYGFQLLARLRGYKVRTGAYRFTANDRCLDIYRRLSRGHQTPVKLVLSDQRTADRLISLMGQQLMADSAEIAAVLLDSAFYTNLGFTPATYPAFFIPNTYEVYWNMDAQALARRLKKEYNGYWNAARRQRAQQIGLTPIEVSTLASIVDEETTNNAEKPIVAGLYINRLNRDIPLQADPTVKFAVGDVSLQRILFKHLEVDSPYNTYKHPGLPPGPIRIPSVQGLNSVLHYAHHDYLYMCAKEDFSGTHNFARTLAQHNANARRYQQALNRLQIR